MSSVQANSQVPQSRIKRKSSSYPTCEDFHYRDRQTFMKLYKQYVHPHLKFASPAWSPWQQGDKEALEKVPEKAVRMVSGLTTSTYLENCVELKLDTLEKRWTGQDLILANKMTREE
jgi:hypothetical protein